VELYLPAEDARYRRLGDVVARRSQSAGGDHGAGPIQRFGYRGSDCFGDVTDGRPSDDLHSRGCQHSRDVRGVGVDSEAEEELVTDGDQLHPLSGQKANTPE
jgi:hypothetical protein